MLCQAIRITCDSVIFLFIFFYFFYFYIFENIL